VDHHNASRVSSAIVFASPRSGNQARAERNQFAASLRLTSVQVLLPESHSTAFLARTPGLAHPQLILREAGFYRRATVFDMTSHQHLEKTGRGTPQRTYHRTGSQILGKTSQ
jgi:muconolactone delta-isomerase